MKLNLASLSFLASLTPLVSGHYVFSKLIVDGQTTKDFEYIRENSNGYQPTLASEIVSDDFRCNKGSMESAAKTKVYTVAPGAEIGFQLAYGATMKHPGPLQIYMSKAPGDVKSYDGSGDWFKVYQEGVCHDISGGLKDTDWCTWDKDTASFKIPENTPAGQYLVRVEHIGLHRGFSGNSEFYFTCAQIEVTGSGSGVPEPLVKIPGMYNPEDPNIHFDIYYPTPTSYDLPGPSVWSGSASGSSPAISAPPVNNAAAASSAAPTTLVTLSKTADTPAPTQPAPSVGTIKKYYQCGGEGWTGSGSCEAGTTCRDWNPWYHQCV
ncbi:glycosyl hydrolase family 61-domain-containing protein [Aspergillus pseudonomiae]|uniref:AA9 family lytic polysaccharide monooxygenase n=1 Tax=Aspergillus pseudonomiae TaxID=1506151 RepID=A0A5N6I8S8_9EURO|nr:glycosyl hydrolase family 61-domain-containing protein [Aspergillus pseudonomiae]KAB8262996.1 glycosyl hydrolase family 61-domain-containing protein [Aspergillus pseudonomiae]KAE8408756.1 glycosyl hydrolase family 61-domain-containing protein [Aspergillus pseudonomiae]